MREPEAVEGPDLIPCPGPASEEERDLFGDFRHLVPMRVLDREVQVPEDNHVLRALQYLDLKGEGPNLRWGRFCWDNTRSCCELRYRRGPDAPEKRGRACRLDVRPGLELLSLPEGSS